MRLLLLLLFLGPLLLPAEDAPPPPAGDPKLRNLSAAELRQFYSDPAGRIVTEWAVQDIDTRTWRSFTKAGYATVLSEGKVEDGQMLFRKGFKHVHDTYPDAEKLMWCTYNGMAQDFFERRNRELLKDDYTLMQMQRFVSDGGKFYYCAVWVKFAPGQKK